jgi:hypothetical protein
VKVEFSPDQFKSLMELVYLGEWMANAIRLPDEHVEQFEEVQQYVFSLAGRFGLGGAVEFDERLGAFVPTNEFEEAMDGYIVEYDNETFWEELVHRLADRDLFYEYGEAVGAMTIEQQIEKREPLVERYEREFEEHGVERLRVVEF